MLATLKTWLSNQFPILEDDAVLQQFKENAFKRAQDFDLKKVLPIYIEYYNTIIDKQKVLTEH